MIIKYKNGMYIVHHCVYARTTRIYLDGRVLWPITKRRPSLAILVLWYTGCKSYIWKKVEVNIYHIFFASSEEKLFLPHALCFSWQGGMAPSWSCHALKLSVCKKLTIRAFFWGIFCFCTSNGSPKAGKSEGVA